MKFRFTSIRMPFDRYVVVARNILFERNQRQVIPSKLPYARPFPTPDGRQILSQHLPIYAFPHLLRQTADRKPTIRFTRAFTQNSPSTRYILYIQTSAPAKPMCLIHLATYQPTDLASSSPVGAGYSGNDVTLIVTSRIT